MTVLQLRSDESNHRTGLFKEDLSSNDSKKHGLPDFSLLHGYVNKKAIQLIRQQTKQFSIQFSLFKEPPVIQQHLLPNNMYLCFLPACLRNQEHAVTIACNYKNLQTSHKKASWHIRARICKRLRSPGIHFASLCRLAGRYDK